MTVTLLSSTASRWKPLFIFGTRTTVRPFNTNLANPSDVRDGAFATAPKVPMVEATPHKGALSPVSFPSARSVGKKIKFASKLTTEEIEPIVEAITAPGRSSTRNATGFHFEPEKGGEDARGFAADISEKEGITELGEELAELGSDVESDFGSDDEFDDLYELGAKNARINREATRLQSNSRSPRVEASSQLSSPKGLPIEARKVQQPPCSRHSSFSSSEASFEPAQGMLLPGAAACTPSTSWQLVPPGSIAAATAVAKRASTTSSFGSSENGEDEHAKPSESGSHTVSTTGSDVGIPPTPQAKSIVDECASSFGDSSDDEN